MTAGLLLALETSSRTGGLALAENGRQLATRALLAERRRTAEILPAIDALLRDVGRTPEDVAILAYSAGPGSFTGLRVAATLAGMWQMSKNVAVVSVPTIEVVARNARLATPPPVRAAILLESKPGFAYCGLCSFDGSLTFLQPPAVLRPEEWLRTLPRPFSVLGDGLRHHHGLCEQLEIPILDEALWAPRVENVAAIGWEMVQAGKTCAEQDILPLYVRPPECEEVYEQRRTAAREKRGE